MKILRIEPTENSPGVIMDPTENTFAIWGESRPEDARKFYMPILEWLDEYYNLRYWEDSKFNKKNPAIVFDFKLEYLNSTSAKFILDILIKIGKFPKDNIDIVVRWHYDEPDLDMKESGEGFEKLSNVPFEHICVKI